MKYNTDASVETANLGKWKMHTRKGFPLVRNLPQLCEMQSSIVSRAIEPRMTSGASCGTPMALTVIRRL